MLVAGIHHVSLNVTDTARALGFYCDLLGMAVLDRPPLGVAGVWLDAGAGLQVHLIEADVPPDLGQHVALAATDLDAAVAELRAAGYRVSEPRQVGDRPFRQSFTSDPDGNRVELTEWSASGAPADI